MIASSTEKTKSARTLAFEALYEIFEKNAYANLTIQSILRWCPLKKEERHLLTELIYGVCRKYNYCLWMISLISDRPMFKIHPAVRILLALGIYQIVFLDRIPESAAVNETVKIAKKVTHIGNVKFINGVLRNFLRRRGSLTLPDRTSNRVFYESLIYNQPEWLIRFFEKEYGMGQSEKILKAFNTISDTCIRVNTLKIETDDIKKQLKLRNISVGDISYMPEALAIKAGTDILFSEFLQTGLIYIQTASSMIPAKVLGPDAGDHVLDMCAAPGSKTTHIAALMGNRGSIDAWDVYPHKVKLIKDNAKRLGISIIHTEVRDSVKPLPFLYETYDKVLLDAPCSGLGVLGHKVELRWRRKESDLSVFPPLQKQLIEQAAKYTKTGGVLVYSTCTLNPDENEHIINEFLSLHSEFAPEEFNFPVLGKSLNGMMTLYPDLVRSDGFFVAKLRKVSHEA